MTKTFSKLGIKGISLKLIKGIYKNPKVKLILNGETQNDFPLKSGTEDVCFHHF